MMKKLLLMVICGNFFVSCDTAEKKPAWKGTVTEENGVTVVRNPIEPLYGPEAVTLTEELSISDKDAGDRYFFKHLLGIAVDENGNTYVLDSSEPFIKVFDNKGNFLRAFGRRGQGPGEYHYPLSLSLYSGNQLMVSDTTIKKILFSTYDGVFCRMVMSSDHFLSIESDSAGNILGDVMIRFNPGVKMELRRYSPEMELIGTIFAEDDKSIRVLNHPSLSFQVVGSDRIVLGYPEDYSFFFYDMDGRLLKKISRLYHPVLRQEEFLRDYERTVKETKEKEGVTFQFNKYENPYIGLCADENDRVYIISLAMEEGQTKEYLDMFDSQGRFISQVHSPGWRIYWKNGRLYCLANDEDGYNVIKRYKITWNY